jgi:hypothetical protein
MADFLSFQEVLAMRFCSLRGKKGSSGSRSGRRGSGKKKHPKLRNLLFEPLENRMLLSGSSGREAGDGDWPGFEFVIGAVCVPESGATIADSSALASPAGYVVFGPQPPVPREQLDPVFRAAQGGPQAPVLYAARELNDSGAGQLFVQGHVPASADQTLEVQVEFVGLDGFSARSIGSAVATTSTPGSPLQFQAVLDAKLGPYERLVARVAGTPEDEMIVSWSVRVKPLPDYDQDGVDPEIEARAPHDGDANDDGVADCLQSDVASVPSARQPVFVTIAAAGRTLRNVQVYDPGSGTGILPVNSVRQAGSLSHVLAEGESEPRSRTCSTAPSASISSMWIRPVWSKSR